MFSPSAFVNLHRLQNSYSAELQPVFSDIFLVCFSEEFILFMCKCYLSMLWTRSLNECLWWSNQVKTKDAAGNLAVMRVILLHKEKNHSAARWSQPSDLLSYSLFPLMSPEARLLWGQLMAGLTSAKRCWRGGSSTSSFSCEAQASCQAS